MALRSKGGFAAFALTLVFAAALVGPVDQGLAAGPATEPSCAEGPSRSGDEIVGTPCADRIVVPASVEHVDAGAGDDTIIALPVTAALPCEGVCLGIRSPVYEGGPGNDVVFGERGNDTIRGNGGDDRLFGGIGDDRLEGGEGNDLLAGGFGADSINGQAGSDYVRGDGTIDRIFDTGGSGGDTLSYASGITPGFNGAQPVTTGFPDEDGERGVRLELGVTGQNGKNGIAADGGGVDEVEVGAFETIIGTPFSDWIVGSSSGETIYGGGGADLIEGGGGNDQIFGGADGDFLDGGTGSNAIAGGTGTDHCVSPETATGASECEGTSKEVAPRGSSSASVGLMSPGVPGRSQLYVTGSSGSDEITATYAPGTVSFALAGGASFDATVPGCSAGGSSASCTVVELDSIVIAGLGGNDKLSANGFPQQTGVVLLGGEGEDTLNGGEGSEDLLVDGRGSAKDVLRGFGRDDALLHHGGPDELFGGDGNDLFLSTSACDNETLSGEEGIDNASWARLEDAAVVNENRGVDARLGPPGKVGRFGNPSCGGGTPDTLLGIEDLEGSNGADTMVGDAGPNQLLGHFGPDEYLGGFGADIVLANSEDSDPLINCGPDIDQAVIDIPTSTYADAAPIECESVREGKPEDFRTVTELPPPPLVTPPPPPPDRRPPATKVAKRPPRLLTTTRRHRRVAFRFSSSEPGSSFRCKLDAKPYRPCVSPRVYNVSLGRHAVRIAAIDAAGNVDRTPALLRFQIRQVPRHATR